MTVKGMYGFDTAELQIHESAQETMSIGLFAIGDPTQILAVF